MGYWMFSNVTPDSGSLKGVGVVASNDIIHAMSIGCGRKLCMLESDEHVPIKLEDNFAVLRSPECKFGHDISEQLLDIVDRALFVNPTFWPKALRLREFFNASNSTEEFMERAPADIRMFKQQFSNPTDNLPAICYNIIRTYLACVYDTAVIRKELSEIILKSNGVTVKC